MVYVMRLDEWVFYTFHSMRITSIKLIMEVRMYKESGHGLSVFILLVGACYVLDQLVRWYFQF